MSQSSAPPFIEGRFDLTGRTVVVTGGGSGIGAVLSEALLAAGARVSIWGRNAQRVAGFAKKVGGRYPENPLPLATDVTDEDSVAEALERVTHAWGTVDGLINCAGSMKVGDSLDFSAEDFRSIVDVNLTGTFICSQHVGEVMRAGQGGSIVNIGSLVTLTGQPRRAAYTASKTAIAGLTRTLAVEWGPLGIRVNAIAPGYIATGMALENARHGLLPIDKVQARTPLRRLARPEELIGGALFLMSDLSSFITGHVLQIDGGWLANGYVE